MSKIFKDLIIEICNENNIKYKLISKDWIFMLEKDDKIRFITGYKFDVNHQAMSLVLDDKYALYDALHNLNIPVCDYKIIYNKNNNNDYAKDCNNYEVVYDYFRDNNNHIVIKVNDKSCGYDVYEVKSIDEINNILDKLFLSNYSVSISPFYNIKTEYRIIVFDKKIVLSYAKKRPIISGDGIHSIKELLIEFNNYYFKDRLNDDKYLRVLNKDEVYEYDWRFNLSRGANFYYIKDEVIKEKLYDIVNKILEKLDIKMASIDIVEVNGKFMVLEINSGIMMDNFIMLDSNGKCIAKDLYTKAIFEMFK